MQSYQQGKESNAAACAGSRKCFEADRTVVCKITYFPLSYKENETKITNEEKCDSKTDDCFNVGESLLWKHQEPWQKELMIKYGNIMCLMDATYKTTRYDLPLFSCVRTNIGYCVIAEFIVQSEAIEYIIVIV